MREDPDFVTLVFELFTLSRRNDDIAVEYAELMRRTREQVAGMLATAQREGVVRLHAEPDTVAEVLFALGDGFALRMLTEPERDFDATVAGRDRLCTRAAGRLTATLHRAIGRLTAHIIGPMPIYEYRRPDGSTFEIVQSFSDDALTHDPDTGVPVAARAACPCGALQGQGLLQHRLRHPQTPARERCRGRGVLEGRGIEDGL